jgi:hypothetical protein
MRLYWRFCSPIVTQEIGHLMESTMRWPTEEISSASQHSQPFDPENLQYSLLCLPDYWMRSAPLRYSYLIKGRYCGPLSHLLQAEDGTHMASKRGVQHTVGLTVSSPLFLSLFIGKRPSNDCQVALPTRSWSPYKGWRFLPSLLSSSCLCLNT